MEKIKDRRYLIAVALATALVVVFAVWPPAAVETLYPFARARTFLARRILPPVAAMFRSSAVALENRRLRREVASLALARGDLERAETENGRLRAALDFRSSVRGSWIAAEVLSSGGAAAGVRQTVRLSKGSLAGVVRNAAVVVPEGLVGRVVSVTPHTCDVLLVTDPALRIACEVESVSSAPPARGILCGGGDETAVLRYLTRADGLSAAHQRVVTSGLGGVFPKGLCVGTLVGLGESVGSVLLAADLSALEFAFIRHED